METRFIGLEGFNEIESLSSKKMPAKTTGRKVKKISTFKKTLRFTKRLFAEVKKSVRRSAAAAAQKKRNASKATAVKATKKPAKSNVTILDRCYSENRVGSRNEYASSARNAVTNITSSNRGRYAHIAPSSKRSVKKKAVFATIACFVAITLSCATVAGAISTTPAAKVTKATASQQTPTQPTTEMLAGTGLFISTADEAATVTNTLLPQSKCQAFYVDGKLIGVTDDVNALKEALDAYLVNYRSEYDADTTTEFVNEIEFKDGDYSSEDAVSVEELMEKAKDLFSVSLETDVTYDMTLDYETEYEYDDSQPASYEEVKKEGKEGTVTVKNRLTFVDGVLTDSVQTEVKTTKEPEKKIAVKGTKTVGVSSGNFIWPLPYTTYLTSEFGQRWGRLHAGLDIAAGGVYGQPIIASDGGVVTHASDDGLGYGIYVTIDHGNGYDTCYAHMSGVAVSVGDRVSQGQTIGYVGSTGNSTGPHLHFEIRENGVAQNPLNYVG